ncbi:tuzin [Angomonas deanei]|uniref:Uncharacterized protein n=1 Tax=Angomonas deanei TaxID=59799 RepID=A0A7G2C7B8_9TRYP|nr:tuzin [Angomonas deanei]CAD2215708.1 hypothetical protein, conserved [Angomonas deanei]|eukprot:EPY22873.1 tuzin [Angomonas deanei]
MVYLKRSVRVLVLEKAEWQRSHHAEMRTLLRERSKERSWRYFIQKYSGFISANFAGLGVLSVFLWNFKNYRKHQRSFQMNHAVKTMTDSVTKRSEKIKANIAANAKNVGATIASMRSHKTTEEEEKGVSSVPGRGDPKRHMSRRRVVEEDPIDRCVGESPIPGQVNYPQFSDARDCSGDDFVVEREEEERWLRRIIRQLDIQHPRITVVTGYHGCGKSTLVRTAVQKENNPSLFVEVRGKDDTLIAILRSLKVPNIDMCGDPTEFIAEVLARTTTLTRKTPIVVLSLRQGSDLKRVYAETVGLSCDRMLCHVVMEVALEKISLTDLNIPRMDFYKVPNFTPRQAFDFTENLIDPVAFQHFVEVMGTNSDEIGELYAAVVHQRMSPSHFTNLKLCKAMRQLQEAWEDNDEIQKVLYRLASLEYETGQHVGGDRTVLQSPQLSDIVLYDPVQHCWLFKRKVLHTAVRCLADPLLPPLS